MSKKKIEKYKDLGNRLYYIIRILNSTVRWKKVVHESIKNDDANIYAFWHQKIFFPTVNLHHVKKKTTLVSPSRDGEMLQSILNKANFTTYKDKEHFIFVSEISELEENIKWLNNIKIKNNSVWNFYEISFKENKVYKIREDAYER